MAKPVDKKKLKYKKMKAKYKTAIQALLDSRDKLLNKISEMEIYYLDKIRFYQELNKSQIVELQEDNENVNLKYLSLLKDKTKKN